MKFDRDKFKALVHYVVWKAGSRDGFGATKLNKVLWFAEARAYMLTGRPIAGAKYVREKWGPVPKAIMAIRAELERDGAIRVIQSRGSGDHTKFVPLFAPSTGMFAADELAAVDYWIRYVDSKTASEISDESHDYAWEIAEMNEEIPLFAMLANRLRDPNGRELAWARSVAERRSSNS